MSRSRTAFTLGLILIIASFLRLYHLKTTPPGLYPDEAMDGTNAQETLQTGHFKVYYPENNGREGLFMNMQAVFLKVIGQNEPWVLRLPSAIFGILTVLGMFSLTRELFRYEIPMSTNIRKQPEDSYIRKKFIFRSEHIALLSAFLLATSFWHINFSRISFRAITAPFFLVWAIYFLLLGFNKLARGEKFRYATLFHIIGGIFFGLGFYTYIAYRVMPLLVLFVIIYFWRIANRNGWVKNFLHSAAHFLFFVGIGKAEHRGVVLDGSKLFEQSATHPLAGRIRRHPFGMGLFQLEQFGKQLVVLGVRNLGRIQHIIAPAIPLYFFAKLSNALLHGIIRHG